MIPHSRPTISDDEINEVLSCLREGQLAAGRRAADLESLAAEYHHLKHASAVSSGTAALHLCLIALGVGKGDEVIIPSYVCTALINAIEYVGARAALADLDEKSFNCSTKRMLDAITPKTAAIIYPYMFGFPARISDLLESGVPVIEDISISLGAMIDNRKIGQDGKAAVISFYATKMLAGGEGGMILTNEDVMIQEIRDLNSYDHREEFRVRYNYKITEIQAALMIAQWRKLDSFIKKRREIAKNYRKALTGLPVEFPVDEKGAEPVYYRYPVFVQKDADEVINKMKNAGVNAERPLFMPIHRYLGLDGFPNSEFAWRHAVSLPIYPSLSEVEQERVIDVFSEALK